MITTKQKNQRIWTAPNVDCPDWCAEHCTESPEDGIAFEIHRRVLERHYFPAQIPTWPNGVRTLTVEQYGETGFMSRPKADLTFWPGKEDETRQSFDAADLREFIRAAQQALELLERIG